MQCEIATVSGKKLSDKKEALKGKDIARDTNREMKSLGY
jgi:tmRNA-binding protein